MLHFYESAAAGEIIMKMNFNCNVFLSRGFSLLQAGSCGGELHFCERSVGGLVAGKLWALCFLLEAIIEATGIDEKTLAECKNRALAGYPGIGFDCKLADGFNDVFQNSPPLHSPHRIANRKIRPLRAYPFGTLIAAQWGIGRLPGCVQ